jgi:hypothetical protein
MLAPSSAGILAGASFCGEEFSSDHVAPCRLLSLQEKMLALFSALSFDPECVRKCPDLSAWTKILNARMGSWLRNLSTRWEYTQVALCQSLVEKNVREEGQKPVKCGYASEAQNGQLPAIRVFETSEPPKDS